MVDWDEVFEDINWKLGATIIILGIIVIAVIIVGALDWHKARTMKHLLDSDLEQIENFQRTWSSPSQAELKDLREQKQEWEEKIAETGVKLPTSLDADELETLLRATANRNRVSVTRLAPQPQRADGYALVLPFEILFTSKDLSAAKTFLSDIHRINTPLAVKSEPLRLGGTMGVTVEFYAFDIDGWKEVNNCDIKTTIPEISFREIDTVKIFKSGLADLKARVDQEAASLADTKKKFTEACRLQTEVDRLRHEYEIIDENIKK